MSGTLTGGKRDRMAMESIFRLIEQCLTDAGWLDAGRQHQPITVVDEYPDEKSTPVINTIAVSYGDTYQNRVEMGSLAEDHVMPVYVDFFAESEALGRHVIGDIYEWVNKNPVLPVYDYDLATPALDFYLHVMDETVEKSRPPRAVNDWQRHWHMLGFMVEDVRTND